MYEAVNDFILKYTDVAQDNLYQGYQNRSTLPQINDWTMYYDQSINRIGTNVEQYSDTEVTLYTLREYIVNIDFCGDDREKLAKRATTLAIVGRSFVGCNFFNEYGITLDYAEDVQYLPFVDEEQQYIHRYRIVLHLSRWDSVVIPQESANTLSAYIENVDVHHQP